MLYLLAGIKSIQDQSITSEAIRSSSAVSITSIAYDAIPVMSVNVTDSFKLRLQLALGQWLAQLQVGLLRHRYCCSLG